MAKKSKKDPKVSAAFHEVYENVPKSVKKTGKTGKAKQEMMTAIALSKARAAGANVPEPPSMQRGGVVPSTGVYNMHKGEKVLPAPGIVSPPVKSLPYGRPGEESPAFGLKIKGSAPGPKDRISMNPFEEEGFSHLQSHETEI